MCAKMGYLHTICTKVHVPKGSLSYRGLVSGGGVREDDPEGGTQEARVDTRPLNTVVEVGQAVWGGSCTGRAEEAGAVADEGIDKKSVLWDCPPVVGTVVVRAEAGAVAALGGRPPFMMKPIEQRELLGWLGWREVRRSRRRGRAAE